MAAGSCGLLSDFGAYPWVEQSRRPTDIGVHRESPGNAEQVQFSAIALSHPSSRLEALALSRGHPRQRAANRIYWFGRSTINTHCVIRFREPAGFATRRRTRVVRADGGPWSASVSVRSGGRSCALAPGAASTACAWLSVAQRRLTPRQRECFNQQDCHAAGPLAYAAHFDRRLPHPLREARRWFPRPLHQRAQRPRRLLARSGSRLRQELRGGGA